MDGSREMLLNRCPSPSGSTCERSNDGQKATESNRAQYTVSSEDRCQDLPLLFIPLACDYLLFLLPSVLRSVCNVGLCLLCSVANDLGIIFIFGTTGLLVELLFGFFFLVFLALLLGFLLFLGRGGLCFLRGRRFV